MSDRDEIVRRMHAEGASDKVIGAAIGMSRGAVCGIRKELGLATARPKADRSEWEPELRRLHAEGLTDRQISARTGIKRSIITCRRVALDLPLIADRVKSQRKGAARKPRPIPQPKQTLEAAPETRLERVIAMARAESQAAQRIWNLGEVDGRRRQPPTGKPPGPARVFDWGKAAKMKGQGMTLSEIGEHFGVTKQAVCKAVKAMGASA